MANLHLRAAILLIPIVLGIGGGCSQKRWTTTSSEAANSRTRDPRQIELEAWVKADPSSTARRIELARHLADSGALREAAEQFDEALKLDPQSELLLSESAAVRFRLKEFESAEQTYGKLTAVNPRSAGGWEGLSGSLFFQRRYLESINAARRAVALTPDEPRFLAALAAALMEHAAQFPSIDASYVEELKEARRELEKLARLWPDKGEIHLRLGRVCMELGTYARAAEALERARVLLPERADSALLLARAWTRLGRRAEALKLINHALETTPDAALYHLKGQLLAARTARDQPIALEAYGQASRRAPDSATLREAYGAALLRAGRLEEARTELTAAAELDPFRAFPLQQLSTLYMRTGESEKARTVAAEASRAAREEQVLRKLQARAESESRSSAIHLILAERYRRMKLPGPAREEYMRALELDPGNTKAKDGLDLLAGGDTRISPIEPAGETVTPGGMPERK